VRGPLEDHFLILLGHAADHADDRLRVPLLELAQAAQGAVDLVLGMLAHTAGVKQNQIGPVGIVGQLVARLRQVGRHQLAVQHVHLAAEGLDV